MSPLKVQSVGALKRGLIGSIIYSICGYLKTMNRIKSGIPNQMEN